MNLTVAALAAAISICAVPSVAADAVTSEQGAAEQLVTRFMQSWSAADADGLSRLFASDGDFVNPNGYSARGRDDIRAFYAAAFASGYAGSKGTGDIASVRSIVQGVAVIDGRWEIDGAKRADGTPRAAEKGILVAVIRNDADGWHIVSLRENTSATDFTPFAAASR